MREAEWDEDPTFAGHGRLVDAAIAALILGAAAAIAVYAVSDMCFHNFITGDEVADSDSERGPWCDAIAPNDGWEKLPIGAFAVFGALVAFLPGPRPLRVALWVLAVIVLFVVPMYMSQLEYTAFP